MNQRTADPLSSTLDTGAQGFTDMGEQGVPAGQSLAPMEGQSAQQFIVAQHVPVRRNYTVIMQRMRALAASAGDRYVYGWEVKDKRNNRKTWIQGPTIKLANDLAREFGNCSVDVRSYDHGTYWMFYARFVDLETGSNYTRAFQQRKSQNTGMGDVDRQADIIFQIGQSKAIRNVVVNVLQTFVDEIVDAAKSSLLEKIGKDPAKAREWLLGEIERLGIDRRRIETIYGRTADKWTHPDMAKLYTELRSISDGMMMADDVYPDPAAAAEKNVEEPQGRRAAAGSKKSDKAEAAKPPKDATINIVDADGKLLGKHSGAELKVGDPWTGPDGLYHVDSIEDREGILEAKVKRKPVVPGGGVAAAAAPAGSPAPGQATQAQPPAANAPSKPAGPAKRKFFDEEK